MPSKSLQDVVSMLRAAEPAEAGDVSIDAWRQAYADLGAMIPPAPEVPVDEVDAGGVPAAWVGDGDGPVVVYLHGGGYCIGSVDTHRSMLTHLAAAIDGRVLAVDYRLAPEHPHPAALEDALAALGYAVSAGTDPGRLVVAGDSAGGGLTVATLVAWRDSGQPLPAAAVCLSPWVDLTQSGASIESRALLDPLVRAADLDRWAAAYRGPLPADDPAISPLYSSLHGLPPLLVHVGTAEVLFDDARRLATAVEEAGGDVTLTVADDMIHVWHFFAGVVPEADEAIGQVARFVRHHAG